MTDVMVCRGLDCGDLLCSPLPSAIEDLIDAMLSSRAFFEEGLKGTLFIVVPVVVAAAVAVVDAASFCRFAAEGPSTI